MFFIILLLIWNFFVSWMNANTVGKWWSESKQIGGFFRVTIVSGYIMAIAGFTMIYGYLLLLLSPYILPLFIKMTPEQIENLITLAFDLLNLYTIFSIIPTGFIILGSSYINFWKHKNFSTGANALYNTISQVHNVVTASREMPNAFSRVCKTLFGGKSSKKKKDTLIISLAIFIIIIAVLGGYFTASAIMKKADKKYDMLSLDNN